MMEKGKVLQIGLSCNQDCLEAVFFEQPDQPVFISMPITESHNFMETLLSKLINKPTRALKLLFICAVFPHQIWSKTLFLPQKLTAQEADNQCRFMLEKELPLSLSELWFDYCSIPLKQSFRLDIFAIQKTVAQQYLQQFEPLKINVLDTITNSLQRAFEYQMKKVLQSTDLLLYQDQQSCLAIQFQPHRTLVLQQSQTKLTALYHQFCRHNEPAATHVYFYSTLPLQEVLPMDWLEVQSELPLIPLGNALWQQEFIQQA